MKPATGAGGPARRELRRGADVPQDIDARDALEWLARGMPEDEISYSDEAPRLTKEQLAEFEPAVFVVQRRRR